jgi:hypothetical protein
VDIAAGLTALGHALRLAKRNADSEAALRDALAICEHSCGTARILQARVLAEMAATLTAAGRPRDAKPLLTQALALLGGELDPDDPQLIAVRRLAAP